jgi:3-deoxy-7-phosphoheptulonate synthase / chorismate mutase
MPEPGVDPVLAELREQIAQLDLAILEAFNRRLEVVAQIRRHKVEHDLPFLDLGREEWLLGHLLEQNRGPISEDGLRELYAKILELAKREVARG